MRSSTPSRSSLDIRAPPSSADVRELVARYRPASAVSRRAAEQPDLERLWLAAVDGGRDRTDRVGRARGHDDERVEFRTELDVVAAARVRGLDEERAILLDPDLLEDVQCVVRPVGREAVAGDRRGKLILAVRVPGIAAPVLVDGARAPRKDEAVSASSAAARAVRDRVGDERQ